MLRCHSRVTARRQHRAGAAGPLLPKSLHDLAAYGRENAFVKVRTAPIRRREACEVLADYGM